MSNTHHDPIPTGAAGNAATFNAALGQLDQAITNGVTGALNNFAAVVDPTVNDDDLLGYSSGSRWINNATDISYECKDATTGAAIWDRVSPTDWASPGNLGSTTPADVTYDTLLAIASTELTIATGVVSITRGNHTIDTEADAASDDLDTINGGVSEQYVLLRAEDTARTVVIKHGTGNIYTISGEDVTLDSTEKAIIAFYDGSNWLVLGDGGGSATVTSVGLSATPASIFDVTGTPVTTSGTLTLTMDDQSANQVLAGPSAGGAAEPAFRALVDDDIPGIDASKIDAGTLAHERGGLEADVSAYTGVPRINGGTTSDLGTGTITEFLRGDYTWQVPAGGGGGAAASPNRLKDSIDYQWGPTTIDSTTIPANNDNTPVFGRWRLLSDGNDVVDITRENTFLPSSGSQYYSQLTIQAAGANKKFGIMSVLSSDDSIPLRNKVVSLQAKLRTIAGSQVTWLRFAILEWSGTADAWDVTDPINVWGAAGTDPTLTANWAYADSSLNLGPGVDLWETRTLENVTLGSSFNNLAVFIWLDDTNKGAGALAQIAQVQLEIGSVATDFVPLVREDFPRRATVWHDEPKIISGNNFTFTLTTSQKYTTYIFQNSPFSSGDAFETYIFMKSGTYTLHVLGASGLNRGQIDWSIDGTVNISGQDWYSASTIFNVEKTATISILYDGIHVLKGEVTGKNISSTDYAIILTKYWIV